MWMALSYTHKGFLVGFAVYFSQKLAEADMPSLFDDHKWTRRAMLWMTIAGGTLALLLSYLPGEWVNTYFFFASIGVYVYTGVTLFCTFWYKYRIHYIEVEKNLIEANAAKAKIPVKMDGLTPELNFEEEFKGVRCVCARAASRRTSCYLCSEPTTNSSRRSRRPRVIPTRSTR